MPFDQVPEFLKTLRKRSGLAGRALEFAILTAARSGEVRGATWDEINLKKKLWVVPAAQMKARAEHRVPLSDEAVALLEDLPQFSDVESDLVFPSLQTGKMLSDMTLAAVLKRMDVPVTVHGFRSSFRDWAAEQTHFTNIVAEQALAHTVQGVEGAYRRGDLLEKRREMMEAWAKYCKSNYSS